MIVGILGAGPEHLSSLPVVKSGLDIVDRGNFCRLGPLAVRERVQGIKSRTDICQWGNKLTQASHDLAKHSFRLRVIDPGGFYFVS